MKRATSTGMAAISTDRGPDPVAAARRSVLTLAAALGLGLLALGCDRGGEPAARAPSGSWSVTAWGEGYEVFPEAPALTVGTSATAHTHVTVLDRFTPLAEGRVEVILRGGAREEVFASGPGERAGIFPVEITPQSGGERELWFRVSGPAGREEIRGGVVQVGEVGAAGRLLRAPAPRGGDVAGEPVAFLKEQQWRADFATEWVRRGSLAESARGIARLRAVAGGDVAITAPVDAIVRPAPWPYPGLAVAAGAPLFRVLPQVSAGRSLAELESRGAVLRADLDAASARRSRLEGLLELEAVSRREVEEAQAREEGLRASLEAARRDLASARSARSGGGGGETVVLTAPVTGRVSSVSVSPGEAVSAGATLARVVRIDPVWVEVFLSPRDAARVGSAAGAPGPSGLVLESGEGPPTSIPGDRLRLVSVAPEVDAATGRVPVLLEVIGEVGMPLGSTVDAQVLLASEDEGEVVPVTALVDDGGVPVVYLQLSGERFLRQEVRVLSRQGERVLVEGLRPGQRLVTRGGEAIRRATLMSTGGGEGHVH